MNPSLNISASCVSPGRVRKQATGRSFAAAAAAVVVVADFEFVAVVVVVAAAAVVVVVVVVGASFVSCAEPGSGKERAGPGRTWPRCSWVHCSWVESRTGPAMNECQKNLNVSQC